MTYRLSALALLCLSIGAPVAAQIEVAEATIDELQEAMTSGRASAVEITEAYLARIHAYDGAGPRLNTLIRLNPDALAEAEAMDRERAERGARGPLHGIPVIVKDNYDVRGLPTSAGTLALAASLPADDAFQVRKLREAGAIILGKANMHELAYGITTIASLGGQTLNPYDLRRNPGGSSGGTGAAIAASFGAVGWGSDTCGSIRIPASHNNLVGLRPTKGLSSIDGILPLSHTQDVGGPLARTMRDLAIALDATIGRDPADPATALLEGRDPPGFVQALDAGVLAGARIGILTDLFGDQAEEAAVNSVVRDAIGRMARLGADTVSVEIPGLDELSSGTSVLALEFKWDLMDYLAGVPNPPITSLTELLELGLMHEALVGTLRRSDAYEVRDSEAYRTAVARRTPLRDAVVEFMNAHGLDALVYPTIRTTAALIGEGQRGSNCQLSASTGLPALSVPAGWSGDLPVGIELLGRPLDDARLVAFGHALEQAESQRRPPHTTPALEDGHAPAPLAFGSAGGGSMGIDMDGDFSWDPISSRLTYDISTGVPADDVLGFVLRHEDAEGRPYVVARLGGPGVTRAVGDLVLNGTMRGRLERGELWLEIMTRTFPFGGSRFGITLPTRYPMPR
jgi:Asp-tRNA(Asn)/Glu-tRNA(Gln) amidotransferase A subunit family amidase